MRKDIEFKTEDGVILRGWHYLPDNKSKLASFNPLDRGILILTASLSKDDPNCKPVSIPSIGAF